MVTISQQKNILRQQMRAKRKAFTGAQKEKADRNIYQKLTHLALFQKATCIETFVSMEDEPDTFPLIRMCLEKGDKILVVPKILHNDIYLQRITSLHDLEKGTMGIWEPKKHCEHKNAVDIDLFLVPGLAFGRDGTRIGFGRGYYDRLLKGIQKPTFGLAYAFQVFDSVPTTPDDVRVREVISDM